MTKQKTVFKLHEKVDKRNARWGKKILPLSFLVICSCLQSSFASVSLEEEGKRMSTLMPMKLGYTILYVDNVEVTIDFYQRAFGFEKKMITDVYGELDTGSTKLAFAANSFVRTLGVTFEEATLSKPAPPVELGLVTEEVEAAYKRAIGAGATEVKEPARKPWGQLVGYVRDNNGFLIEICSPMK